MLVVLVCLDGCLVGGLVVYGLGWTFGFIIVGFDLLFGGWVFSWFLFGFYFFNGFCELRGVVVVWFVGFIFRVVVLF